MANEYIYINHKFKVDNSDFFLYIFILFSLFFSKSNYTLHITQKKHPKTCVYARFVVTSARPFPFFLLPLSVYVFPVKRGQPHPPNLVLRRLRFVDYCLQAILAFCGIYANFL